MARKSAKYLQDIQLDFETGDQLVRKEFTIKWEKTGMEPGCFLIEGEQVEINGQEIAMGACRNKDISKLIELWQNSLQNKIKREPLIYQPHLYVEQLAKLKEITPDIDDITRGYGCEFRLHRAIIYIATNKRGNTYKADDAAGTRAHLVTGEAATQLRSKYVPLTTEELEELKENLRLLLKDVDNQLKTCYATFVEQSTELLNNTVTTLKDRLPSEPEPAGQIDFTSVISRYIK